jgi:hypothetical protein
MIVNGVLLTFGNSICSANDQADFGMDQALIPCQLILCK